MHDLIAFLRNVLYISQPTCQMCDRIACVSSSKRFIFLDTVEPFYKFSKRQIEKKEHKQNYVALATDISTTLFFIECCDLDIETLSYFPCIIFESAFWAHELKSIWPTFTFFPTNTHRVSMLQSKVHSHLTTWKYAHIKRKFVMCYARVTGTTYTPHRIANRALNRRKKQWENEKKRNNIETILPRVQCTWKISTRTNNHD